MTVTASDGVLSASEMTTITIDDYTLTASLQLGSANVSTGAPFTLATYQLGIGKDDFEIGFVSAALFCPQFPNQFFCIAVGLKMVNFFQLLDQVGAARRDAIDVVIRRHKANNLVN